MMFARRVSRAASWPTKVMIKGFELRSDVDDV
jgi:hypothetical protein